jgi:hypothetical protein
MHARLRLALGITSYSRFMQAISMGIALPKWLLEGDAKMQPILLAGLVLVFILLPLVAAACYLFSADKYVGKDGIVAETYEIFLRWAFEPRPMRQCSYMSCVAALRNHTAQPLQTASSVHWHTHAL